jgi:hypothetical protein
MPSWFRSAFRLSPGMQRLPDKRLKTVDRIPNRTGIQAQGCRLPTWHLLGAFRHQILPIGSCHPALDPRPRSGRCTRHVIEEGKLYRLLCKDLAHHRIPELT